MFLVWDGLEIRIVIYVCLRVGVQLRNLTMQPIYHMYMDGGVLSVPLVLNDFPEKYVALWRMGRDICREQKSERYNFFIDIDYKNESSLDLDEIKDICKVICDKVKSMVVEIVSFPYHLRRSAVNSLRLVFTWIGRFVVDQSSAIALRNMFWWLFRRPRKI